MAYKAQNIQNGFKATGLVPLDPNMFIKSLQFNFELQHPLQVERAIHNLHAYKRLKIHVNSSARLLQLRSGLVSIQQAP